MLSIARLGLTILFFSQLTPSRLKDLRRILWNFNVNFNIIICMEISNTLLHTNYNASIQILFRQRSCWSIEIKSDLAIRRKKTHLHPGIWILAQRNYKVLTNACTVGEPSHSFYFDIMNQEKKRNVFPQSLLRGKWEDTNVLFFFNIQINVLVESSGEHRTTTIPFSQCEPKVPEINSEQQLCKHYTFAIGDSRIPSTQIIYDKWRTLAKCQHLSPGHSLKKAAWNN